MVEDAGAEIYCGTQIDYCHLVKGEKYHLTTVPLDPRYV